MKANLITLALLMVALVFLGALCTRCGVDLGQDGGRGDCGGVDGAAGGGAAAVGRVVLGAGEGEETGDRRGVYSRIRNPIYVFGELFMLGLSMVLGNWILLLVGVALVPMQVARARKEEQVLREAFGEEYERYKAGRGSDEATPLTEWRRFRRYTNAVSYKEMVGAGG